MGFSLHAGRAHAPPTPLLWEAPSMRRSCTALHELMRRSCMLPPALHAALEGGSSPLRSCPGQSLAAVRAAPDTLGCPWRTYVYVKVHAACGRLSASSSHADGQSGGEEALAARRTAARMPWPAASPLGRLHQNCRRRAAGATPRAPPPWTRDRRPRGRRRHRPPPRCRDRWPVLQ